MADKQIQPVNRRDYQITPRTRPRGLWGQTWTVVLQPGYFFRTLPPMAATRSWLWAAIFILAITGISAVRQEALLNEATGALSPINFGGPPPGTDLGGDLGGISSGGGFEVAPVGVPGDSGIPPMGETPAGGAADVTATWTTALVTAAGIIVGWFILMILLSEVSLFNGRLPILGHNFQIAIWASIPLALMAILQLVYYAAGGTVREDGISGLLTDWEAYQSMSPFVQSLILSLFSRLTLFWIWSLILIYVGARNALHGKRFASLLVVAAWAVVLVVLPVVTGAVKAPEASEVVLPELITDPSLAPDGGMSPELSDPFGASSEGAFSEITPEAKGDSFTIEPAAPPEASEATNIQPAPSEGEVESTEPTAIPRPQRDG
jgi:hypothetical protein